MRLFPALVLTLALALSVSETGCATAHRLQRVSLDMSKEEVRKCMGNPTVVRGSIRNKYGQNIEVWEYTLTLPPTSGETAAKAGITAVTFGFALPFVLLAQKDSRYWLYFFDGKLAQWGQAGDWAREADRIYEFRFGSDTALTSPAKD